LLQQQVLSGPFIGSFSFDSPAGVFFQVYVVSKLVRAVSFFAFGFEVNSNQFFQRCWNLDGSNDSNQK